MRNHQQTQEHYNARNVPVDKVCTQKIPLPMVASFITTATCLCRYFFGCEVVAIRDQIIVSRIWPPHLQLFNYNAATYTHSHTYTHPYAHLQLHTKLCILFHVLSPLQTHLELWVQRICPWNIVVLLFIEGDTHIGVIEYLMQS